MKRGRLALGFAAVVACAWVASVATAAMGKNPIVGEWDLDVAKTTRTGMAPPTGGHVSVTAAKDGLHGVVDYTTAKGTAIHYEYVTPKDATPSPVTGNTYFDSVTVVQVDRNTAIRTERRAGKVVGITTIEVSKDGKTLTSSVKGTTADGQTFSGTSVWTRAKSKKK